MGAHAAQHRPWDKGELCVLTALHIAAEARERVFKLLEWTVAGRSNDFSCANMKGTAGFESPSRLHNGCWLDTQHWLPYLPQEESEMRYGILNQRKDEVLTSISDEQKPTCKRCEKARVKCAGYERPLHFRIAVAPAATKSIEDSDANTTQRSNQDRVQSRTTTPLPDSMSLVAFKPDICFTYLNENFVWRGYGDGWLDRAMAGNISPLALYSVSALSQSHFGTTHHQDDIKTSGNVQYGKAVKYLIPELSTPSKPGSEALLITIMLLLMHDSLKPDPAASVSHVFGLVKLIMTCGPKKFQREPLRSAFSSARATLITVGIISKRRCFLEDEKWRIVPWALDPASKSEQNHLADILVTVPGMLEEDAKLFQREDPVALAGLVDRVLQQLVKLFEWRWQWQERHQFVTWEEPAPASSHQEEDRPFQSRLAFFDFERATEIALYNAVHMWLIGFLWRIVPNEAGKLIADAAITALAITKLTPTSYLTPLALPGQSCTLREVAIEIVRVFDYQCHNSAHCRNSALFYVLPIGLAYSVLEAEPLYRTWIRSILDMSIVTRGYAIGQNVMGFGFYLRGMPLHETVTRTTRSVN